MKAIEFLKSQYIKDEIDNWKPESLDAMAAFMEAYHSHKNNGVLADVSKRLISVDDSILFHLKEGDVSIRTELFCEDKEQYMAYSIYKDKKLMQRNSGSYIKMINEINAY